MEYDRSPDRLLNTINNVGVQPLKKVCFLTEILGNLFKYICFFVLFFCLLLHRLAVRISLRFIFFYKFNCTDPGLQLGDPAPLIGLLIAVDLLTFYIF